MKSIDSLRIALVGFGEVGCIFGSALVNAGVSSVTAFDTGMVAFARHKQR